MSRIAEIDAQEPLLDGASEMLRISEKAGAPDPRMAKVFVRSRTGVRFLQYWADALYEGELPHRLKEIVRIYLSASHGCAYCSQVRSNLGATQGVDDDLLLKLDDIERNDRLTADEKCALRFAARMKEGTADDDALFDDLRTRFSDSQIVELGLFCGTVLGIGGFAKLLHVVTWDEVCSLNRSMVELKKLGT